MLATSACAVATENSSTNAAIRLQQTSPFNAASSVQLPRLIESRSLKKGCGVSWITKGQKFGKLITASTFYFSFKSGAAKKAALLPEGETETMSKRNGTRRAWTSEQVRTLKTLARKKTPAGKIARALKRTEGATRQKAFSLGLSLETRF